MQTSKLIRDVEQDLRDTFDQLEDTAYTNQTRILRAFQHHRVR
jgi:cystathionine beta-lyase family protein involved in aluminum resistance